MYVVYNYKNTILIKYISFMFFCIPFRFFHLSLLFFLNFSILCPCAIPSFRFFFFRKFNHVPIYFLYSHNFYFYINIFGIIRSTLPYTSQLIGPAAQLMFTIATIIQSPSNGFFFHPTSYSGTPISPQPTVQWVNFVIGLVWFSFLTFAVSELIIAVGGEMMCSVIIW